MLHDLELFFLGMLAALVLHSSARFLALQRLRKRSEGRTHGYNFTNRVRMALAAARKSAAELGHEYVGTEHILLGVLRTEPGVAFAVLLDLRVDIDQLRANVLALVERGSGVPTGSDLPYTSRAKRAVEESMAAARELNQNYVGTEHLLLGLIREKDGVAARALAQSGVTLDNARAHTLRKPNDAP